MKDFIIKCSEYGKDLKGSNNSLSFIFITECESLVISPEGLSGAADIKNTMSSSSSKEHLDHIPAVPSGPPQ